ncbi:hypothetical protein AMAG_13982 [Allomyces macrogynus ATCC 38327]|uniref:Uncharacterized protein n=1 Tax=Allomyces macrogynus (strain ATCC 38327) TaxID=578462 RepID=A0A0L0T378_ALLM3|nr:hypothetical protein AMAG_13982 [Allomyces macrogynus ATCC 38327]|eukprot:KNE69125.1 hypothetical protein AMAG_13982 [Allomyces macrogynus ATCC 38327]
MPPSAAAPAGAGALFPPMNASALDSGIYLMRRAAEEDAKGNRPASTDLYMAALDAFIFALPADLDATRRTDLQAKLTQLVAKLAGVPEPAPQAPTPATSVPPMMYPPWMMMPPHAAGAVVAPGSPAAAAAPHPMMYNPYAFHPAYGMVPPGYPPHAAYPYPYGMMPHVPATTPTTAPVAAPAVPADPPTPVSPAPTLSETIIKAAVAGAVALKQSPIPDAVTGALATGFSTLQALEAKYRVKDHAVALGKAAVAKAVQVDRDYQVHEKVGDALLTGLSALTQAAWAYKHAPGYDEAADQAATQAAQAVQAQAQWQQSQQHQKHLFMMPPPAYDALPPVVPHAGSRPASPTVPRFQLLSS